MLRNAKLLLLDEATASVDFETDARIQRTLSLSLQPCWRESMPQA